jgi:hypothetical protein
MITKAHYLSIFRARSGRSPWKLDPSIIIVKICDHIVTRIVRASPAGRRILPTQMVRPGPFAARAGHNLRRGLARLAGAPSGATHPVRR